MAPVAPHCFQIQQHESLLALRLCEHRVRPRLPSQLGGLRSAHGRLSRRLLRASQRRDQQQCEQSTKQVLHRCPPTIRQIPTKWMLLDVTKRVSQPWFIRVSLGFPLFCFFYSAASPNDPPGPTPSPQQTASYSTANPWDVSPTGFHSHACCAASQSISRPQ